MRPYFSIAALLGVMVLLSSAPLVEAQKKKKDDLDPKEGKTSEKMIKAGQLSGKVRNIYESKKSLRITVSVPLTKINQGAVTALAQARQNYANALARRDFNGARSAQMQMIQHQANIYKVEYKNQDVELTTVDEVEVRIAKPKPDYDEKGNLKKLTRKELKALKGPDPKKPGYTAEFGDVQPDQIIRVQLVKKKDAPRPKPVRKRDKEELDLLADNQPQVKSIMILYDPAWAPPPPAPKGKLK